MNAGVGVGYLSASALAMFLLISSAELQAQVDCVWPAPIHLSRVVGKVVDPFGAPIPHVQISLSGGDRLIETTHADALGAFALKVPSATYRLRADLKPFAPLQADVIVGQDVIHAIRHSSLNVILGLPGSSCSWATTNRSEFEHEIELNKRRLSGNKEKNATQK